MTIVSLWTWIPWRDLGRTGIMVQGADGNVKPYFILSDRRPALWRAPPSLRSPAAKSRARGMTALNELPIVARHEGQTTVKSVPVRSRADGMLRE